MNILLDTHILIWALADSPKLPEAARQLILNADNGIFYSVISLWEIEIKHQAKPDKLPITAFEVSNYCKEAGYKLIQLKDSNVFHLPALKRPISETVHKDPFDKMLICQAITENMMLLTHDALIKGYEVDNIIIV